MLKAWEVWRQDNFIEELYREIDRDSIYGRDSEDIRRFVKKLEEEEKNDE